MVTINSYMVILVCDFACLAQDVVCSANLKHAGPGRDPCGLLAMLVSYCWPLTNNLLA